MVSFLCKQQVGCFTDPWSSGHDVTFTRLRSPVRKQYATKVWAGPVFLNLVRFHFTDETYLNEVFAEHTHGLF